jgi:hypothetical protein
MLRVFQAANIAAKIEPTETQGQYRVIVDQNLLADKEKSKEKDTFLYYRFTYTTPASSILLNVLQEEAAAAKDQTQSNATPYNGAIPPALSKFLNTNQNG